MSVQKPKREQRGLSTPILLTIVAIAVIIAVVVILISSNASTSIATDINYDEIPQSLTEDGANVLGNPEAETTIVVWEDFLCPHCQNAQPTIHRFIEEYVVTGQAKFEFRYLPAVDPTYSALAGSLAYCAGELDGSFWEAHDVLFQMSSAERFHERSPRQFAERIGLSYNDLLDCTETQDQVTIDQNLGREVGVQGTPAFYYRKGDSDVLTPVSGRGAVNFDSLAAVVNQ